MKRVMILVSALTLCLCIITVTIISKGSASAGYINTIDRVVDETVNIPEPANNKGLVPAHIRWEPMLGFYILKDAKYNPLTKSFDFPDNLTPSSNNYESEAIRRDSWLKNSSKSTDFLVTGLIAYMKCDAENPTFSSLKLPSTNKAVTDMLIPLGVPYLNEMLDMVMNQKLFNAPLMYSIEQIAHISCMPEAVMFDDNQTSHDIWRNNLKNILKNVESAVQKGEDLSKYGIFAIPFLVDKENTNIDEFIENNLLILNNGKFNMRNTSSISEWLKDNKNAIIEIKECIDKYR